MTNNRLTKPQSFLEKPLFMTLMVNWEIVLYALIFVVAIASRFYDLGARVMSHDESLHALFSYKLYNGEGYRHDPMMHGPLQFHLVALSFLLFGDNDFTARIPSAVFGVALVMMPYWFRPWLGRLGALVASFGLLISPLLLYYDRYIRNESFIAFFTALLALSLFQYMRSRQIRWLYIGAVAVSLSLATKEVAFIHGFIGMLFIGAAYAWEKLGRTRFTQIGIALWGATGVLLVTAIALMMVPAQPEGTDWAKLAGAVLMVAGLLVSAVTVAFNTDRKNKPVSSALDAISTEIARIAVAGLFLAVAGAIVLAVVSAVSLYTTQLVAISGPVEAAIIGLSVLASATLAFFLLQWVFFRLKASILPNLVWPDVNNLLLGPIAVAIVLFFLFHTTFFTNPAGFDSGTRGALTYWLNQQDVARGGQPGFYYLMLMPMYEFLPFLLGGIGGLVYLFKKAPSFAEESTVDVKGGDPQSIYPSDGGTFAAYLILWTITSFVIYSWAGEKMPWLTVHVTLPFIFLLGHVTQAVFNRFDWQTLKTRTGFLFTLLVPLAGAALLAMLSARPFQGQSIQDLQATFRFVIAFAAVIGIGYGLWVVGQRLSRRVIKPILYLVIFSIFSIFTIRFAWLSSYVNYDYVNEFLVYAHGAPDIKWMLDEIDDISRRTVGDKQIKVAYGGVIWPMEWYMREYPNRAFYNTPNRDALDAPVVIVSPDDKVLLEDVEPYLGNNYQRFDYRQVWWPVENYKGQTLKRVWNDFFVPAPVQTIEGVDPAQSEQAAWETVHRNRKWLWDVLFYRKVNDETFAEWPYRTKMYFFVRKDIVNELWDYRTGPLTVQEAVVDPYDKVRVDLPAMLVWGSSGALDGQFVGPRSMAVSPAGQIYVADGGNHRIQVFDRDGNFLKAWGGVEGPGPGELTEPWGVAISDTGRVYVADTWNHRVQIFDEDGTYLSEFGTFADAQGDVNAFPGSLWGPRDLLLDAQGNVYVADTGNKRIQKFSPDGEFLAVWGGGGVVPGRFEEPVGLAMDSLGNIYVTDAWNRRVQKFDSGFNFIAEWPVEGWDSQNILNKPYIAIDSRDRIFITDPENYRVIVYSNTGDLLGTFGQYGQDVESFRLPIDLAFGSDDILFVLDSENNRVMKFKY